jgi:CYTH domain-containing protein
MKTIYRRRFLLADLPAPLTRASEHLQFFDNYLTETRLLLRQIRTPKTRLWERRFVQEFPVETSDFSKLDYAEIDLSEYEYEVLSVFEGNELRYNRYFYELENGKLEIDMILNRELWNLIFATARFETEAEMRAFSPPDFAAREITQEEFFLPQNLINSTLEDVKKHLETI